MTTKKFSNALGNIGESYIDEAATYTAKKKNNVWVKWGSIAACFALLLCIGIPLTLHLIPNGDIGDDHGGYPFETLEVGESMTYDNGTISYDEHNETSISFTINVTDPTEYVYREYRLGKGYYIEFEENGKITAENGESHYVNEFFDITLNGEPINVITDKYGNVDYDFTFMTTPGTYKIVIDYSKLFAADGDAAISDFTISGIVAFNAKQFENNAE